METQVTAMRKFCHIIIPGRPLVWCRDLHFSAVCVIIVIIFVALIGIIGKFGLNVPENTAFDNLAQELAEGDNIVDAVTAFCRDIIENAKQVE